MKALLPILAGLALVACKGEPTDNVETNTSTEISDTAAKAQKVALSIEGMT